MLPHLRVSSNEANLFIRLTKSLSIVLHLIPIEQLSQVQPEGDNQFSNYITFLKPETDFFSLLTLQRKGPKETFLPTLTIFGKTLVFQLKFQASHK